MDLLTRLEGSWTGESTTRWFHDNFLLSPAFSLVYLAAVFLGRRWMRYRKPYSLRRELAVWNAALALLSIVGFVRLTPSLMEKLTEEGFASSVCSTRKVANPNVFWIAVFALSKVVEFGDTMFIVLRKTPLMFLHWYHHFTVCLFSWYMASLNITDSTGHWFCWMNVGVHSTMYTYYLVKSTGVRLPSVVSTCVTLLQIVQFAVGMVCVGVAWWALRSGYPCQTSVAANRFGWIIYGSYLILFTRFFYNRYLR